MSILQKAADAILTSDRNKAPEWGGQKLTHVERVDVDGDGENSPFLVTVHSKDGRTAQALPRRELVNVPKDRAMAPADVEAAVAAAIHEAASDLAAVH